MGDNIDYCKKCKCRYIRTNEDYNIFGEPYKICSKCRIRNKKRTENKSINKADDIDAKNTIVKVDRIDTKLMRKCVICKELWKREDTEKVWESFECLKCYNCRSNGVNPDDIDISHEIYPVKKRNPVWKPDSSSESD